MPTTHFIAASLGSMDGAERAGTRILRANAWWAGVAGASRPGWLSPENALAFGPARGIAGGSAMAKAKKKAKTRASAARKPAPRRGARAKPAARSKQRFAVSHHREEDF